MPKIETYDARLLPQGGQLTGRATANDFGAREGAALQNLGQSLEKASLAWKAAEDNQQTLAASGTLNSFQREAQDELANRQNNIDPQTFNPESFAKDYDNWISEKSSELIATTENNAARDYMTRQADQLRTHMYEQAKDTAASMYRETTKVTLRTSQSQASDVISQNPDNNNFNAVVGRQADSIQSLKFDPAVKLQLADQSINELGAVQVTAAIAKNSAVFMPTTQPGTPGVTLAPPSQTARMVGGGQPTLAQPVEGANPDAVPPPISPTGYNGPTDPGAEISRAGPVVVDPKSLQAGIRDNLSKLEGWKYLTEEQKQHAVGMVISQSNKNASSESAELERQVKDRMAMMANGKVPDDLNDPRFSRQNFVRVFGADVGTRAADAWTYQQSVGKALSLVNGMTPDQMRATASTLEPQGPEGYAEKARSYSAFVEAANRVAAFREKNPMEWGLQIGLNGVKPINFNDYDQMGAELNRRGQAAVNMAKNFGLKPQILTEADTDLAVNVLNKMAPIDKIHFLQRMRQSFGTDTQGTALFRTMMDQISPKSPMTAMAANLATKTGTAVIDGKTVNPVTVSQFVLEGEYILRGSKVEDPTQTSKPAEFQENQLKTAFNNKMGNAFRNLNAVYGARAQTEMYQAVKNYIAADHYHNGGGDLKTWAMDPKNVDRAINAVTGGLWTRNGDVLMAPWGYPMDSFQNEFNDRAKGALVSAGLLDAKDNMPVGYSFDNYADGKYAFRNGTGYLYDKDGKTVIVDYSKPRPAQTSGKNWNFDVLTNVTPMGGY